MQDVWDRARQDATVSATFDIIHPSDEMEYRADEVWGQCRQAEEEEEAAKPAEDLSHERIQHMAKFTDRLPLDRFIGVFELVPSLVNVVTLCEALPHPKSVGGGKLPLDLHLIASRCSNSYFAPRRFAAVQLAFSDPRSRVLVFHTGRIVGTGCDSAMAARLAVARAQRQIAHEANIYLRLRNFAVINQVAAASIGATLDCDSFADSHSSDSHYDRASFVGLAWRPAHESICCEIYSTGRANLPGSTRTYDLLHSWSRMAAELYRHTNKPDRVSLFREDLRSCHLPSENSKRPKRSPALAIPPPKPTADLWGADDWALGGDAEMAEGMDFDDGDELLTAAGL